MVAKELQFHLHQHADDLVAQGHSARRGAAAGAARARRCESRSAPKLRHSLWQQRFDADAGVVVKTIYLNGQPFTAVGVMPESFLGSAFYLRQAFWVPVMMVQKFGRRAEWRTDRSYALFNLYGRLKPGVTIAQAAEGYETLSAGTS